MNEFEINGVYLSKLHQRLAREAISQIKEAISGSDYTDEDDYVHSYLLDDRLDPKTSLDLKSWLFLYQNCQPTDTLDFDQPALIRHIAQNFYEYKGYISTRNLISCMRISNDLGSYIDEFDLSDLCYDQLIPILPFLSEDHIDQLVLKNTFNIETYISLAKHMPHKKEAYLDILLNLMNERSLIALLYYAHEEQNWSFFNKVLDGIKEHIDVNIQGGAISIINSYIKLLFSDSFLFLLNNEHLKQIQTIFLPYKERLNPDKRALFDGLCDIKNETITKELINNHIRIYLFSIRSQPSSIVYNDYTMHLLFHDPILASHFETDPRLLVLFVCCYFDKYKSSVVSLDNKINRKLISLLENPCHGFKDQFLSAYIALLDSDHEDYINDKMIDEMLKIANMPEVISKRNTARMLEIDFDWYDVQEKLNVAINHELTILD